MIEYKVRDDSIERKADGAVIPADDANRDFQQFKQDVKDRGVKIIEGKDVVTEDYRTQRTGPEGYAPIGDQLDMQHHDARNNTRTWIQHCRAVKKRFPKTIERTVRIAPLPDWVKALVGG